MNQLNDEDEFSAMLKCAEPEIPQASRQALMDALLQPASDGAVLADQRPVASPLSGGHRLLAFVSGLLALVVICVALPQDHVANAYTLAEFRAEKAEADILSKRLQRLERLDAIDESIFRHVSATDVRASESLWMLVQEYEFDSSGQKQQAQLIVSLYAATPAADRCRKIFPDL